MGYTPFFSYQNLGNLKIHIFAFITFAFAAILFIVCNGNVISSHVLMPFSSRGSTAKALQTGESTVLIKATIEDTRKLYSIEEGSTDHIGDRTSVVPPKNVSAKERIVWFRKMLPDMEIFNSDNLTKGFDNRVLGFFDDKYCEVRFFLTWISPVSSFGRRELMAMESLFNVHPRGCLMILSRTMDSASGHDILKPLLDLKFRVAAVTPDMSFLLKGTPAEAWFEELKRGNNDPGQIPLSQNLSNLVRLAILYKYGGVYMDTDFIVLKSFKTLRNSIGVQTIDKETQKWKLLNNAVLVFDKNHPLLFKLLEEFALTFNGNRWGHNGPYLVSRVVQRMVGKPEYNFTILPRKAFYPVDWINIESFFKKPETMIDSRWVKAKLLELREETYGLHLWNRESRKFHIEEGSVISRLVADNCVTCQQVLS